MATKAQMISDINAAYPDNTSGLITPLTVRNQEIEEVNSWQQAPIVSVQAGVSYTVAANDYGVLLIFTNASLATVTLPLASSFNPFNVFIKATGAGGVLINPTSPNTIDGASSVSLGTGSSTSLVSDGTNWRTWVSTNLFGATLNGLAPASGGGTSNFLRADGSWVPPPSGGSGISNGVNHGVAINNAATTIASSIVLGANEFLVGQASADPINKTAAQVNVILPAFGTTTKGLVPSPGSVSNLFLRDDGTWQAPPSGGSGITGGVNHAIAITNGATTIAASVLLGGDQLLVGVSSADPVAATVGGDVTAAQSAGTMTFTIGNAKVSYAKIQNVAGLSVFGNSGSSAGTGGNVTGTSNQVLRVDNAGTTLAFGSINLASGSAVTGTLPVANGGTNTSAFGSSGTIFRSGATTTTAPTFDAPATAANYQANTSDKILNTTNVWAAAAKVTLTDGATVTPDFSTGIDFTWTLGAVGRTLANPTNAKAGQKGVIYLVQDGTGSRTITTWGSAYKFSGGTKPTLSTAANSVDLISYVVRDTTPTLDCFFTAAMS